jgi:hypothetical protein
MHLEENKKNEDSDLVNARDCNESFVQERAHCFLTTLSPNILHKVIKFCKGRLQVKSKSRKSNSTV